MLAPEIRPSATASAIASFAQSDTLPASGKVLKLERTWTPADLSVFPDAGSVSGWAKDALADAVALGLISGASNGGQTYLEPQGSATREQVATILMEFCKNVKK